MIQCISNYRRNVTKADYYYKSIFLEIHLKVLWEAITLLLMFFGINGRKLNNSSITLAELHHTAPWCLNRWKDKTDLYIHIILYICI